MRRMTYSGRLTWGLVFWAASVAAWGQSELLVKVKPANKELKANVEGYIGTLGDRDEQALLRFSRGAQEQARKAAQALAIIRRRSTPRSSRPPRPTSTRN